MLGCLKSPVALAVALALSAAADVRATTLAERAAAIDAPSPAADAPSLSRRGV